MYRDMRYDHFLKPTEGISWQLRHAILAFLNSTWDMGALIQSPYVTKGSNGGRKVKGGLGGRVGGHGDIQPEAADGNRLS